MSKNCYLIATVFMTSVMTQSAFAVLCPKTYTQIRVGMTADQVTSACGKPQSVQEQRMTVSKNISTETWIYGSEAQSKTTSKAMQNLGYVSAPSESKRFVFDDKGVVMSISVAEVSTDSTSVCGSVITKNVTSNSMVRASCGEPDSVHRGSKKLDTGSAKVQIWIYQFDQFRPPVQLQFEEGKLARISE